MIRLEMSVNVLKIFKTITWFFKIPYQDTWIYVLKFKLVSWKDVLKGCFERRLERVFWRGVLKRRLEIKVCVLKKRRLERSLEILIIVLKRRLEMVVSWKDVLKWSLEILTIVLKRRETYQRIPYWQVSWLTVIIILMQYQWGLIQNLRQNPWRQLNLRQAQHPYPLSFPCMLLIIRLDSMLKTPKRWRWNKGRSAIYSR